MPEIIGVQFKEKGKSYYFDAGQLSIQKGQMVIVENAQGIDCGKCGGADACHGANITWDGDRTCCYDRYFKMRRRWGLRTGKIL